MTDFLTADTNLPSYMMFPRFLLDMEINETAKMLYIILLDRARLSQKNEGWSDTDGHVFIYFTIEALAEVLHKSQMTVKTALAVLEKQELIFRKRQGPGHPNRIYVKIPKETLSNTDRILSSRQTENCPIDRQDSFPDTDRKLSGNKKEIKKNNLAIRGSKEPLSPYGKFQNVFLSEKELEDIRQTIPDWKDYIERLSGYMASTGKQYQNHAATIISSISSIISCISFCNKAFISLPFIILTFSVFFDLSEAAFSPPTSGSNVATTSPLSSKTSVHFFTGGLSVCIVSLNLSLL